MSRQWRIPGWSIITACMAVSACALLPVEGNATNSTTEAGEIGIITDWVLAGPLPNPAMDVPAPDGSARAGWNIDYLESIGGEESATLSVDRPFEVQIGGETRTIRPLAATAGHRGVVDLLRGLRINERQGTEQVAYGYTSIDIPSPGTYHFLMGADDAAKLFVNGELHFSEWHHGRGITPGEYHVEIDLDAGTHDVLLKVDNNSGPWAFSLGVYTDNGLEEYMERERLGPPDFPRVDFGGQERESEAWNRYTWHHFHKRHGNFSTLFVREYMTIADIWLANAMEVSSGKPMQDVIRSWSDNTPVDPDGYVQSAQHFSHAHDGGWPFPLWPQVYGGHDGWTIGWHFQEHGGPGWVWEFNMIQQGSPHAGQTAADIWRLDGARSEGVRGSSWRVHLEERGASLATPEGIRIDSYNAPFIQIRWNREGNPPRGGEPYLEWKRVDDENWSSERRMFITDYPSEGVFTNTTGMRHAHVPVYTHPKWDGTIKALRFVPAPGEAG
ncbi:MAG: hypothetical protein JJU11_01870, partial [Candidatus Sumerlaeia bacterium]|nr:hypothetical protein [Candidatus Sumerlaeia bacterium]